MQIAEEIESHVTYDNIEYVTYTYFIRKNGVLHIQCDEHLTNGDISYYYYTIWYEKDILQEVLGDCTEGKMETHFSQLEVVY